jgi:hypothetical protein
MSAKNTRPLTLIKANIALFQGDRAEVLRLVAQYENERPATHDPHRSEVSWLRAQAQPTDDERIRLLYDLIRTVAADDDYGRMARDYLEAEEAYTPSTDSSNRWLWASGAVGLVLIVALIGLFLFNPAGSENSDVTPTTDTSEALIATATLPDRSELLVAAAYELRTERGILQIAAFEDDSQRIVDTGTGEPIQAVAGARFLALRIAFECRSGICSNPPEATLTLVTDNGDLIEVRDGVQMVGELMMEPIALGRSTTGWVVFELPSLNRAETLLVAPFEATEDTPPLTVDLSGLGN